MSNRTHIVKDNRISGVMKKCPICGREFFTPDVNTWAYKKYHAKLNGSTISYFFCRWNCLRQWEKVHRPEKKPKEEDWEF